MPFPWEIRVVPHASAEIRWCFLTSPWWELSHPSPEKTACVLHLSSFQFCGDALCLLKIPLVAQDKNRVAPYFIFILILFYSWSSNISPILFCINIVYMPTKKQRGGTCGAMCPMQGGYYRPTARNRYFLKRYKQGKSIGFTMRASLKAKGLIPRANGTKRVSAKYQTLQ
jgi:hypothetical protein